MTRPWLGRAKQVRRKSDGLVGDIRAYDTELGWVRVLWLGGTESWIRVADVETLS